jgi:GNAT superfamily N-acetyltransferase
MSIIEFASKDISERLATSDDLQILLEIEQSAFPVSRWATLDSLAERLAFPAGSTWIAFVAGAPAAFANGFPIKDFRTQAELDPEDRELYLEQSKIWLLRNMAVRPEYQGRLIGKKLFDRQIESAKQFGAEVIRFTTTKSHSDSMRSLGFELISAPSEFHGVTQGVWELRIPR